MRSSPPKVLRRVLALLAVLANAVFSYGYTRLGGGAEKVAVISERYDNLFSPASYAFAIWGVIHLALITYAVITLMPSQSHIALHDRIATPLIAASALMMGWVAAFTNDRPIVSLVIVVAVLICAIAMYRRVTAALTVGPQRRSWLFPFSLLLAWISVATIANATIALVALGAYPKSVPLATLMLAAAVVLGLLMAARFRDVVFPLVIAWASLALALRGASSSTVFATAALIGALVSLAASIVLVLLRMEQTFGFGVPIRRQPSLAEPAPA